MGCPSVACEPGQVLLVDCKLARQELHQRGVLPVYGPGGLIHVPRTGTRFSLETHSYRSHRQQRSVANERQMRRPQELHENGYGTRSIIT